MTSYKRLCELEVHWYRQNGQYPSRIKRDRDGIEYVVGDWSWNRKHKKKQEYVEHLMPFAPESPP